MPLLLTEFHLYLRKYDLQDTSPETSGKYKKLNKKHREEGIIQKYAKEKNREAHPNISTGQIPTWTRSWPN
jgi:hypothetical protein